MFHTIGETAGEIWKLLAQEGPLSITAIAGNTSLLIFGVGLALYILSLISVTMT